MPSILSGCLILLKIAMAVNDGLHSMLSSIYSIIENVLSSDHDMKPVQESTDSAPIAFCSESRILEAFNRRRANLPIYEQTEVYVSNMNPYQEITITNKDCDRKRKRSSSIVRKSYQSKGDENPPSPHDVRTNEEICSTCPGNSQSSTSSLVSSDTGNESEYQSCKNLNGSVELEENIVNICVEDKPGNTTNILESSNEEKTSTESDDSPNSSFLKVLQSQIKSASQNLQSALEKVKNPPTRNIYGLSDSESTDSEEITSEICTSSSPEESICRKPFLGETMRLYEKFLHDYCHRNKDANLRETPNERELKTGAFTSNGNEPTLDDVARTNSFPTCPPPTSSRQVNETQQKRNIVPSITISDYSSDQTDLNCTRFGNLSESKPVSKIPATKHVNTYQLPLSLQKDRWIELDDFNHLESKDSKKSFQNADLFKRNTLIQSEQTDVNQTHIEDESSEDISSEDGNCNSTDGLKVCQSPLKCNLSSHPLNLKELDYSDELDYISLERVDFLKTVHEVGATEVLEYDSNVDKHHAEKCMLNFSSKSESSHSEKCADEESGIESALTQTFLLDVDYIPLRDLDTEEKQITYLNDLTEYYKKRMQTVFSTQKNIPNNELLVNFEERHKIMLDTITNGYRNRLDSITRNAGMCRNELCSIDSDLKTKFGLSNFKQQENNSTGNWLQKYKSPKTFTPAVEFQACGLPLFLTNSPSEPSKPVENEQECETFFQNKDNSLFETEIASGTTFNLDKARNETSTPKKEEKIDDHIWVSINLSSRSRNECSMNDGKDSISRAYDSKFRTNILANDPELALEQELSASDNLQEDISLEAEDWRDFAAQMSKNYENVVSLLNSMDDSECVSMKVEHNSAENEDCNINTGKVETEMTSTEVLNYDRATTAQTEPPNNKHSSKELEEELIHSSKREFNNASPVITDDTKLMNQDLFDAVLECLRKENIINENASFETLDEQMKIYNYLESYLYSADKNMEKTKLQLLKITTDRLKFLDIKSKSNLSSENEEKISDFVGSTPISNMDHLIKREKLDADDIYDDFQICDKEENDSHADNLSTKDSNHNFGSRSENTLLPNEDETSCNEGEISCNEDGTSCNEDETSCNEDETSCNEDETSFNENEISCNDEETSCKENET